MWLPLLTTMSSQGPSSFPTSSPWPLKGSHSSTWSSPLASVCAKAASGCGRPSPPTWVALVRCLSGTPVHSCWGGWEIGAQFHGHCGFAHHASTHLWFGTSNQRRDFAINVQGDPGSSVPVGGGHTLRRPHSVPLRKDWVQGVVRGEPRLQEEEAVGEPVGAAAAGCPVSRVPWAVHTLSQHVLGAHGHGGRQAEQGAVK